jgi:hypothetical protein
LKASIAYCDKIYNIQPSKEKEPKIGPKNFHRYLGLKQKPVSLRSAANEYSFTVEMLRRYVNTDPTAERDIKIAEKAYSFAKINEDKLWRPSIENVKEDPKDTEKILSYESSDVRTRGEWKSIKRNSLIFGSASVATLALMAYNFVPEFTKYGWDTDYLFIKVISLAAFTKASTYFLKKSRSATKTLSISESYNTYDVNDDGNPAN